MTSPAMRIARRRFGNTELHVSSLGLGTAEIGFSQSSDAALDSMLGVAYDAGINVLDSAAMYGDAEEQLGRSLSGRRDQFLLFTKCGRHLPRLSSLGQRSLRRVRRIAGKLLGEPSYEWHPATLQANIDESLRRLRTDRIDLMQLHSCSEDILARGDAIRALQKAKQAGKVRYIGYSGDGPVALWAVRSGCFDAIQLSVNVADQQPLDDVIPRALAAGLGVIAKRPIANAVWRYADRPDEERLHAYWHRMQSLHYDFVANSDAVATALGFTLRAGVHTAIVGTTSSKHLKSNVSAASAADVPFETIRNRWKQAASQEWVAQM
jgi:aryl-alcohol dehydrogenase-like predicted oxidoreductase